MKPILNEFKALVDQYQPDEKVTLTMAENHRADFCVLTQPDWEELIEESDWTELTMQLPDSPPLTNEDWLHAVKSQLAKHDARIVKCQIKKTATKMRLVGTADR